jgi:hypothetical protein
MSAEELSVELRAAGPPPPVGSDALEAFISSGDSEDPSWAALDTAEVRAEVDS